MNRDAKLKMCRDLVRWARDDCHKAIETIEINVQKYRLTKRAFEQMQKAITTILDILEEDSHE